MGCLTQSLGPSTSVTLQNMQNTNVQEGISIKGLEFYYNRKAQELYTR